MKIFSLLNKMWIGSKPVIMGFDGGRVKTEEDFQSVADSLRGYTGGIRLEEYPDHIYARRKSFWQDPFGMSRQREINDLKDKLHEKGCNYFYRNSNLNVDAGVNHVAKLMSGRSTVSWGFMNAGTTGGDTTPDMTDLIAPLTPRLPLSGAWDSFNYAYHSCFYGLNDGNGAGTATWREVAPFTLITGGIMLGRFAIPEYDKDDTRAVKIVYSTRLTPET